MRESRCCPWDKTCPSRWTIRIKQDKDPFLLWGHFLYYSPIIAQQKSNCCGKTYGDYVIVKYDEEFYPGKSTALGEYAKVHAMIQSGPKYWKWATWEDILDYEFEKVVKIIKAPIVVSHRRTFCVPELDYLENW